ncbi:MAG: hypothetical protein QNJ16_03640 [Rhodobacter sp.]|nr:hypothetical protein [Rhodobacter sp.]
MTPFEVPQSISSFRRYSEEEALAFAHRTGWLDDVGVFDATHGVVQAAPTPWWPECQLVTMQNPDWENVMGAWVLDGTTSRLVRLDGTSPPIHRLNAKHGTALTADLALPYLGFFCTFVHGEEGMFGLVASGREAILPSDWPADKLGKLLKPAKLVSEDERGFRVETSVVYSNALFWAHFLVQRSGMSEMLEDEPQAADLDTKIRLRLRFEDKPETHEKTAEDEPEQVH